MKKIFTSVAVMFAALTFTACGDDNKPSDNGGNESAVKQVNRVDDLGGCNKNKFGEIIYVAETDSLYECTGKGWVATDSSAIEGLLTESSSSESDDDESSDSKSSSSFKTDSTDIADVETVKVDSVTLSGFAQKGPFASGTAVTVFGLDSLLEKTKTKFTGKVNGDSGAYKVSSIVLPSQFALVEVSGFFKSEISGKNSSGTKTTLSAIVDLSEGKSVKANVNIFTTLEYARVKHLVAKEKFNVPAAKKRATAELLAFFGAKADDDMAATSISLDTTAAGEALLTASVMLLSDLSASKFGSRLSDIEDLFAESGIIADDELLVAIADWASKVDSTDNFESIRKNVKEMKLFATVPDFDGYIYKFWTTEYKLGACTDSLEETIKKNENKKSDNYGMGYACTSKRWHKSTALDTDLGLCTAKKDGSFEERKQEKKDSEYYVCRAGTWNKITETQFELKECTDKRENEYVKTKSDEYFVCSDKQWKELDAVTYELKLCTENRNLELAKTEKSGSYVCEWNGETGAWRKASTLESDIGVCGSAKISKGTFKQNGEKYYVCGDTWKETDAVSFELKAECIQDSVFMKSNADKYYACLNGSWEEVEKVSYEIGKFCNKDNDSTLADGYACVHTGSGNDAVYSWREQTAGEKANNAFCTKNTSHTDALNGYVCAAEVVSGAYVYEWREATATEKTTGKVCTSSISDTMIESYVCEVASEDANTSYEWREASDAEKTTGGVCNTKDQWDSYKDSTGTPKIIQGYVCVRQNNYPKNYMWRAASKTELSLGRACNYNNNCGFGNAKWACEIKSGYVCKRGDLGNASDWSGLNQYELRAGAVCHNLGSNEINMGPGETRNGCSCRVNYSWYCE